MMSHRNATPARSATTKWSVIIDLTEARPHGDTNTRSHFIHDDTIRAPNVFEYHFVNTELPFQSVVCTYECVDK